MITNLKNVWSLLAVLATMSAATNAFAIEKRAYETYLNLLAESFFVSAEVEDREWCGLFEAVEGMMPEVRQNANGRVGEAILTLFEAKRDYTSMLCRYAERLLEFLNKLRSPPGGYFRSNATLGGWLDSTLRQHLRFTESYCNIETGTPRGLLDLSAKVGEVERTIPLKNFAPSERVLLLDLQRDLRQMLTLIEPVCVAAIAGIHEVHRNLLLFLETQ